MTAAETAFLASAKAYCAACDETEAAKAAHLASGGQIDSPEFGAVKRAIRAQARAFAKMRAAYRQTVAPPPTPPPDTSGHKWINYKGNTRCQLCGAFGGAGDKPSARCCEAEA